MDTIVVSNMVRLVPRGVKNGSAFYAEYYANWETGNRFSVPQNSSMERTIEIYKSKFPNGK